LPAFIKAAPENQLDAIPS